MDTSVISKVKYRISRVYSYLLGVFRNGNKKKSIANYVRVVPEELHNEYIKLTNARLKEWDE
jgi:1,2-phenylacetyl-CoA epoxidase catalytic subunit